VKGRVVAGVLPQRVGVCFVALILFASAQANAQATAPGPHDEAANDFMNLLAHDGLHDLKDETWNAYGQFTAISSSKLPFYAPYTNANGSNKSLLPGAEESFTGTLTVFLGVRLWHGGEFYLVPEVIAERPLSGLNGIGGAIQNFELQKTGSETPQLYRSRAYLRQTFGLGGGRVVKDSQPQVLGTVVDSRRLVLTAGNFSIIDMFDRNSISGDSRENFLNMAFMTHASWDFPSDARGYSWGGVGELYWDDWALRFGRITPPQNPNQLAVDFRIWEFYGDQAELEHDHVLLGQPGAVRLLGYRNHVDTGKFADAIAAFEANPADNAAACSSHNYFNYGSTNANAPDLCYVRRGNVKVGAGINLEQHITADTGVFLRAMYSDGQTEVDAFNSADRSLSVGALGKGSAWHRPFDVTGIGYGISWISHVHAQYLAMGGVDGFVGDGNLRQAGEGVVDLFYSVNLLKAIWLTADYQHLWHPGFNADRGPVEIISGRVHAEF
jgi:high affinity Mn2+ porin